MSSLAGLLSPSCADPGRVVAAMLRVFPDRGPDGVWVRSSGPLTLGVGLAGDDATPATDPAGRWMVALDGAPNNLRPLREELVARGRVDEGASAAAVVAAILAEVGVERALGRLDGELALAAWDAEAGRLILARDRVGARSLHYASDPDGLRFATDLAAVRPGLPALDPAGVARLVRFGFVPPPGAPLAGVRRLPAGHVLTADADGVRVAPYWSHGVSPPGAGGARARWARSVEYATALAVRHRLGEGPVAVAVGGVYSQAVARIAADRRPPVTLLTLAGSPEVPAVRALAAELRRELVEVVIDDVPGLLDAVADLPAPLVTPEAVAWMALSRAAWERGVPVLLSGEGGAATHGLPEPPAGLRGRISRFARLAPRPADPGFRAALDAPDLPDEDVWGEVDALARARPAGDPAAQLGWLHRTLTLPEGALATLDLVAAAQQVAARSPLADARLATLVAEIPAELLRGRALFLEAFPAVAPSPPRPFRVDPGPWLRGPLAAEVAALPTALADLVSPDHVAWVTKTPGMTRRLWALSALSRWLARRVG